jgi:bacterioferritin-associated ferredoxin
MIVCQCKVVSHRTIDAAIAAGAETVGAIGRACGAGTVCGGCVCTLKRRLADARPSLRACAPPEERRDEPARQHG